MKTGIQRTTVEISGVANSPTQFGIDINAKSFRVLSDTLYSDKIGSMIREISSNAADSHVEAGIPDEQFILHLPSKLEPWFSVQDFGVGLSADGVESTFTTYFKSTRDESNNCMGGFGLGSKTPFAYTDQFQICAIQDGMKRLYNCFLDEGQLPQLVKTAEAETDDGNGVTITVAVDEEDIREFATKAADQLRFFSVQPKVTNHHEFKVKTIQVALTSPLIDVLVRQEIKTSWGTKKLEDAKIWIKQGEVGYVLKSNEVSDSLTSKTKELLSYLGQHGAILKFNIGEVEVQPNREGISYTKRTIANIVAMLEDSREALFTELRNLLDNMECDWDRALYLNENKMVRGAKILDYKFVDGLEYGSYGNAIRFDGDQLTHNTKSQLQVASLIKYVSPQTGECVISRQRAAKTTSTIEIKKDLHVFVRDTKKKPVARLKFFAENNHWQALYMIEKTHNDIEFSDKEIRKLCKTMGGFKVRRLSSLDEPPRPTYAGRGSTTQPTGYYMPPVLSHNSFYVADWQRMYEPLDQIVDEMIYFPVHRFDMVNPLGANVKELMIYLSNHNDDVTVVGLNVRNSKKVADLNNWTLVEDYIAQYVKNFDTSILDNLAILKAWNKIGAAAQPIAPSDYQNFFSGEAYRLPYDFNSLERLREIAIFKGEKANKKLNGIPVDLMLGILETDSDEYNIPQWATVVITRINAIQESVQFLKSMRSDYYNTFDDDKAEHAIDYINAMLN